jgi:septal ring factor EnvC (AmiA/AmiB activator)
VAEGNDQATRSNLEEVFVSLKKLLTNLLLVLALALCGLVAVQWVRETRLRQQLQAALDSVQGKSESVAALQDQLKRSEEQVQRVEKLRTELAQQLQTNSATTLTLRKDLDRIRTEAEQNKKALENYKSALERANQNIKQQNQDISKQNEQLNSVAAERNAMAAKYNKLAKDFDDLAKRWNEQQKELAAKKQ